MSVEQKTKDLSLKSGKKNDKKVDSKPKKADGPVLIGITVKKDEDFPSWYQQVLTKSEMLDYYDVSGCYILRPPSYYIWEKIQEYLDKNFKSIGVQNGYFPMFVSSKVLEREKDHIEGFAPEVAWVTRAGNTELEEPLALRPTSETVMYPYYAKWIRSHRDLPLRLNQWNSVVRWEFKHPQPFLRTREFLWQEGHTAHLTKELAVEEVMQIIEFYYNAYKDVLAVPMIKGRKSDKERFAGSLFSISCEGYIPATGRGIQGATSHCLGQNFSKMFDIVVEDPNAQNGSSEEPGKIYVWQNSWGFSTRSIGVMVMVHSDDKGLVLPPRVASTQVLLVPCGLTAKTSAEDRQNVIEACKNVEAMLRESGIRADGDYRENYSPGWKFADSELRGIPLRVEIGPKDLEKKQCIAVARHNHSKTPLAIEGLADSVKKMLDEIHEAMYNKAKREFDSNIVQVMKVAEMCKPLDEKRVLLAPFCGREECEDGIKANTVRQSSEVEDTRAPSMGAKTLCIPLEQPDLPENTPCAGCNQKAQFWTLFGRSY